MLDADPAGVTVAVRPELPAPAADARAARHEADLADEAATRVTAETVRVLRTEGYTVRDVGVLLGLSPQRVSQIARAGHRRKGRRRKTAA
jgi:hypothetical protein